MNRFAFAPVVVLLFLASTGAALSQAGADKSEMPYSGAPCTADGGIKPSPRQVEMFNKFDAALKSALKRNDAAALAFLVQFPLRVNTDKGTILIPDAESLGGHYAEIFPPKIRVAVIASGREDYICRYDEGLGYKDGVIWVSTDDHRFTLDAVNTPDLHAKSDKPVLRYTCETTTHRISIEELTSGKYRYRSWNKPKELSDLPDVDLTQGEVQWGGTGVCATPTYSFKNGNVLYEVDAGLGCTDGSEPAKATGQLRVTVDGKQVMEAWCF